MRRRLASARHRTIPDNLPSLNMANTLNTPDTAIRADQEGLEGLDDRQCPLQATGRRHHADARGLAACCSLG